MTMALAYSGLLDASRETMHQVAQELRGQPWNAGTPTTFAQMTALADARGVPQRTLRTMDEVHGALDQAQPVILLVDNQSLEPPQYPRTTAFYGSHFVLLIGYTDDGYHVADPLSVSVRAPVVYTRSSVLAAVDRVGVVAALGMGRPPE
jgi:hypothetical protein